MMLSKKHLIVGGLGFIGINLINNLPADSTILCIDDTSNAVPIQIRTKLLNHPNTKIFEKDINDGDIWATIHEWIGEDECDVWHLAANSDIRLSGSSPVIDSQKTFLTTVSVIEIVRKIPVKNLIFASTSAVYGLPEDSNTAVVENSVLQPISYYGAAKLASEVFLDVLATQSNVKQYIFRFANIVGFPATHGLILDIMKHVLSGLNPIPVLGNGEQKKTYLHVQELVGNMVDLVSVGLTGKYNLGPNDQGIRVKDIVTMIRDHVAKESQIVFQEESFGWVGDVPKISMNCSKRDQAIGRVGESSTTAVHKAIHQIADQLELKYSCVNL